MLIESSNIADAWDKSIKCIIDYGEWIPAERGNRAKELRNVLFSISSPDIQPQISNKYNFSKDFLNKYSDNYLLSEKTLDTVAERINKFGVTSLNQTERIIQILSSHYFSRRAVISTWDQNLDLFSNHPPCLISLQFQIRNKLLEITAILRSNDAWFAALPDLIAVHKIQLKVAKALSVSIGSLNMLSINYHIYEMDYLKAINVFPSTKKLENGINIY